jgi:hypothetical protein
MHQRSTLYAGWSRLGIALAAALILYVRLRIVLWNPQFWAEDGAVFFSGLETDPHHGWGMVLTYYSGYIHLLPRLIAIGASVLPIVAVPLGYAWASILGAAVVAWAIQSPRIRLPGGAIAAIALAAVPHTGEVYGKICNLQWITALMLLGILISDDPESLAESWGDGIGLMLTGLTGPFILLALPFFAWRAFRRRSKASGFLFVAALVCSGVQAPLLMLKNPSSVAAPWDGVHLLAVVGRRLFVGVFLGGIRPSPGVAAAVALAIPVILMIAVWRNRKVLPGGLMLIAVTTVLVGVSQLKVRFDNLPYDDLGNGDRYFFTAKVVLVWLIAAVALTHRARAVRVGLWAALGLGLIMNRAAFVYGPFPDLNWPRYAAEIQRGHAVKVPILPEGISFYYPGAPPPLPHPPAP